VTGDAVLASVDIQSATAATLSGSSMSFGTVLPGNTVTGTETYGLAFGHRFGRRVDGVGVLVHEVHEHGNTVGDDERCRCG
jgi:hypothetical protein